MKRIIVVLILFTTLLNSQDKIRFAPLPMENAVETLKIFYPMIKYLENNLNKNIEIIYRGTNKEVVEGLINNNIDLAYLGPLPYVNLLTQSNHNKAITQFLEKNNKKTYTCTMFIRSEDNINLSLIKDKKFALPQKYSTCGYTFAQEVLNKSDLSLDNNKFKYTGSHYDSIVEVLSGNYDIGTVKTTIFNKFKYLGIKQVALSQPNPGLVLVANTKNLSQKLVHHIQELIINTSEEERLTWGKKIRKKSILPKEELFEQYKNRVKGIIPKDEK